MIREYQSTDLEQVINIWLTANQQAHDFIDPQFFANNVDLMRMVIPLSTVYVQDLDGVKGFIGLTDNYIAGLFVAKDYQRQGIGKALLTKAQQLHPELTVSVFQQNQDALAFYQANGFDIVNEAINEETAMPEYLLQSSSERAIKIGKCAL